MRVFQLIKMVLDEEVKLLSGDLPDAIKEELEYLQASYKFLTRDGREPLTYDSRTRRFAYIFKYTTMHADLVSRKIGMVPELRALFERDDWVDVACVGGGPGSDFLGIIKYMVRAGSSAKKLKVFLLDKEQGWFDAWANVEQHADDLNFRLSTNSQILDVTDPSTWSSQTKYRQADLFTFVYFVSEVYGYDRAKDYFQDLLSSAKSGSYFLFIDNRDYDFYTFFDTLATAAGLDQLARSEEICTMDLGEEKSELHPYPTYLDHFPKLTTSIAWRVYRKP